MDLKIGSTSVSKMYKGSVEITKGYLGSSLIYSSSAPATALTDANFFTARDLWFTDQAQAEDTYGLIEDWNTTAVTNMRNAFAYAGVVTNTFNEDISSWDIGNVTNFNTMFYRSSAFNQPIGIWDTGSAATMYGMMWKASSFNQNISSWDIGLVTNVFRIVKNTSFITSNYDSLLIGWEATLQLAYPSGTGSPNLVLDSGSVQYTSAATTARESLINNFGTTITDGGLV